jgi:hypothetical protein
VSVGFFALLLAACGDDGSGSATEPTGAGTTGDTGDTATAAGTDTTATTGGTATSTATSGPSTSTATVTSEPTVGESESDGATTDAGELSGCVVVVDGATGSDAAPGGSWFFAKATVNAGLAAAEALALEGRGPCEVWVAAGTYAPSDAIDPDATFSLRPDVALYGGFAGGEASRDARDWVANPTILSGELGAADTLDDNVRHVVTGADGARLDGFTITGGYARGAAGERDGAGVHHVGGALTIANCQITDNRTGPGGDHEVGSIGGTGGFGAGVYASSGSLSLIDSAIASNLSGPGGEGKAIGGIGGEGSGVAFVNGDTLTVRRVIFDSNTSGAGGLGGNVGGPGGGGAGLYVAGASGAVRITASTFIHNTAGAGGPSPNLGGPGAGGALTLLNLSGDAVVDRCLFTDNTNGAGGSPNGPGGAFAAVLLGGHLGTGGMLVANSRVVGNTGDFAAGVGLLADPQAAGGPIYLVNTEITGNTASRNAGLFIRANGNREVLVANTTIAGNTAMFGDTGLLFQSSENAGDSPIRVVNAILWGNEGDPNPELATNAFNLMVPTVLEIGRSAVQGGCAPDDVLSCGEVLTDDPSFVDLGGGDLHLGPASALKDAGDDASLPADVGDLDDDGDVDEATPLDLDDLPRVVGAAVDLGAYELQ